MKNSDPWKKYSMSGGIAELTAEDVSFEQVFKRADKKMYENKAKYKKAHGKRAR